MTNSIAIFANDTAVVSFQNKKGDSFSASTEGALFKGGMALRALKDTAKLSAYHKAESGRYRAAAEIVGAAFPAINKAFESFMGTPAWSSKTAMILMLDKVEAFRPKEGKDYTAKQKEVLGFVSALRGINALASDKPAMVIEA